jgi:hypothetical protein
MDGEQRARNAYFVALRVINDAMPDRVTGYSARVGPVEISKDNAAQKRVESLDHE